MNIASNVTNLVPVTRDWESTQEVQIGGVTDTVDYKENDKVEASEKEDVIPDLTGKSVALAGVTEQEQDDTESSEGSKESKDKNEDDNFGFVIMNLKWMTSTFWRREIDDRGQVHWLWRLESLGSHYWLQSRICVLSKGLLWNYQDGLCWSWQERRHKSQSQMILIFILLGCLN